LVLHAGFLGFGSLLFLLAGQLKVFVFAVVLEFFIVGARSFLGLAFACELFGGWVTLGYQPIAILVLPARKAKSKTSNTIVHGQHYYSKV
jgi:hypothetical protein